MEERLVKIGKKIKSIKTSQQSQHDIIKEVLLELLEIIAEELNYLSKSKISKDANKEANSHVK